MIPATDGTLRRGFKIAETPSRTFKLNTDAEIIAGYVDGIEAVKQAIYLMLSVERYEHIIHSRNYGAELADLIGKPVSFCLPEIKWRITEALSQDSRITGVDNFDFDVSKKRVHATFTVNTVFGAVEAERTVEI